MQWTERKQMDFEKLQAIGLLSAARKRKRFCIKA